MRLSPVRYPLLALVLLLSGCADLGYYRHLAHGQWQIVKAQKPIAVVSADPQTPDTTKIRLARALDARQWAIQYLGLPANDSYLQYADLGRRYSVWNVYAAAPLSVSAHEQCFPIAGCVAYRGFYNRELAQQEALRLEAQGLETYVVGISAYSTLGWFDDPIVSPMLQWTDERLALTIFHELAHQVVYLPGDTAFNESYATFVGRQGLRFWLQAQGLPEVAEQEYVQEAQFLTLILKAREQLEHIYRQDHSDSEKLRQKNAVFAALPQQYQQLQQSKAVPSGYEHYFASGLNNAKLVPFGIYNQHVDAFAQLFLSKNGNWWAFHQAVSELAQLPTADRQARLHQLATAHANTAQTP